MNIYRCVISKEWNRQDITRVDKINNLDKKEKGTKNWSLWSVEHQYINLLKLIGSESRRQSVIKAAGSWVDQRVFRWFGHVERMNKQLMASRVFTAEVSGKQVRGRPRLCWMDCVSVALGSEVMIIETARQCTNDAKESRALVHLLMIEFYTAFFAWFMCSFWPPSRAFVAYHQERGGMPLNYNKDAASDTMARYLVYGIRGDCG